MNRNKKIILYSSLLFNIILVLTCISLFYDLRKATPLKDIKGYYQSIQYLPDVYSYSFTNEEDGEFFFKINDNAEKGKYKKYENNVYICYGEKNIKIISLLNKGFYFYDDKNNRVVEMKKISDVPEHINHWQLRKLSLENSFLNYLNQFHRILLLEYFLFL